MLLHRKLALIVLGNPFLQMLCKLLHRKLVMEELGNPFLQMLCKLLHRKRAVKELENLVQLPFKSSYKKNRYFNLKENFNLTFFKLKCFFI